MPCTENCQVYYCCANLALLEEISGGSLLLLLSHSVSLSGGGRGRLNLPAINQRNFVVVVLLLSGAPSEVLALKHESRILGQWSNPASGSRKSQACSPSAKQHRASPLPSWRNHIQGWMKVRESYSRALEQVPRRPLRSSVR